MHLDEIDWETLTVAEAKKLIPLANQREQTLGRGFNLGEVSESTWLGAFDLWENLRVFVNCGLKPGEE